MAGVELRPPEIQEDELRDPFRRRVAVLVAVITLFGSFVAYLQTREANREERAAGEAQLHAILGLGAQAKTSSVFTSAYAIFTQSQLLDRRAMLASGRARFAGASGNASAFSSESQRWAAVRDSLDDLSPLLNEDRYRADADPAFPRHYAGEIQLEPDRARLRQAAAAELIDAHSDKAGRYVAIITALAVALFLLGLSLIGPGSGRRVLFITGVGVAIVCAARTGIVLGEAVPTTPDGAIEAVADGNRLMLEGRWDDAVTAYDRALAMREDYALAYALRANGVFLRGSPQAFTSNVSITDDASLREAIRDQEKALLHGSGNDITVLAGLGFNYFLAGRYDDSVRLSERANALNDGLPFLWYNLGVAELARGNESRAERFYAAGNRLNAGEEAGDEFRRSSVFAGARTDLELLARAEPARRESVLRFAAGITAAEAAYRLGADVGGPPLGASVGPVTMTALGREVRAEFDLRNIPAGTPLSYVWYHRPDPNWPWASVAHVNYFELLPAGQPPRRFVIARPESCPLPGDYRVDIYVGTARMGSGEYTVPAATLGRLVAVDDQVRGVQLCRPENWTEERDPELDAFTFTGPTGVISVSTFVVPAEAVTTTAAQFLESTIQTVGTGAGAQRAGPFENVNIGGIDGRAAVFDLGSVGRLVFAAALGSDSVVRVVFWGGLSTTYETIGNELVPTISFDVRF